MSSQSGLSSVQQYICLLQEKDNGVREAVMKKLIKIVDSNWSEISDYIQQIEDLYEDKTFSQPQSAAFLASKIYYHLEELEDSLNMALKAGDLFDLNEKSQYVECLISKCIEKYVAFRQQEGSEKQTLEAQYVNIVEKMFEKSINGGELKQALGIAIESRRIDKINEILSSDVQRNRDSTDLLSYLYDLAMHFVLSQSFRQELLKVVASAYQSKAKENRDYIQLAQCYFFLNDVKSFGDLIRNLVLNGKRDLAYQISLDISENDAQYFNEKLETQWIEEVDENFVKEKAILLSLIKGILRDKTFTKFLRHNLKSDPQVILKIKNEVNYRKSVPHTAVIYANAIFNAGTHNGYFLKDNFNWVDKADNWSRFAAIASVGVIHKGNFAEALQIYEKYLAGPHQGAKKDNELGGALYGLGLVYVCNKDQDILDRIVTKMLENSAKGQVIHGGCLGLGLIGLASRDENLTGTMRDHLMAGETVVAEAAALGIGMVNAGSGDLNLIKEMSEFASDIDREKIQISIGQSIAMIMFRLEEQADTVIEQLLSSQEASIRLGGVLTLGFAYVGTTNYEVIKKLLYHAVDDVSDDVRRSAVISLAFVMFKQYDQLPKYMKLLSISYNPHTRYGTAIALGIACAGTYYKEALDIIEPLLSDSTEFVQQGALVGTALILQQANDKIEPRLEKFKKTIDEIIKNPLKNQLVKFGAILAQSILEAGGRNQIVTLASSSGFPRLQSCIGMLVFSQFWYFYPRIHFLSLALQPQCIIGVVPRSGNNTNEDVLRIPKNFKFQTNCKQSQFDYIPMIVNNEKKDDQDQQVAKLSITNKAKMRAEKKKKDGDPSLSIQKKDQLSLHKKASSSTKLDIVKRNSKILEGEGEKDKMELEQVKEEGDKSQEPQNYIQQNPSRVLEKQRKFVQYLDKDARYFPLIPERKQGIILLSDSQKDQPEEYVLENTSQASEAPKGAMEAEQQNKKDQSAGDVQPPEDFVFDASIQDSNKQ